MIRRAGRRDFLVSDDVPGVILTVGRAGEAARARESDPTQDKSCGGKSGI